MLQNILPIPLKTCPKTELFLHFGVQAPRHEEIQTVYYYILQGISRRNVLSFGIFFYILREGPLLGLAGGVYERHPPSA